MTKHWISLILAAFVTAAPLAAEAAPAKSPAKAELCKGQEPRKGEEDHEACEQGANAPWDVGSKAPGRARSGGSAAAGLADARVQQE
jgi:hypothetical protein